MNELREIVTKAIVAKGKKKFILKENVEADLTPYSVLGCWIINHEFEATRKDKTVNISGEFEIDIWYSTNENKETQIAKKKVKYNNKIIAKQVVNDYIENSEDVIARLVQHPTCLNANIKDDIINLEVQFEYIAEILGEIIVSVTVFEQIDNWDDNLENEIDEDFLEEEE